ncbi:uncharacterized protein LOC143177140 [Calliopsis andreniformis]|uniref:uncharacterized protein LOC143177140 n=1 Tax=Calliopsis andreniformis TaxID=337506 RepID=UPI003FCE8637
MRGNDSPGVLLLCISICMVMVLLSSSGTVYAKRGCSAFGHSCFGGHGKRFDSLLRDNGLQRKQAMANGKNEKLERTRLNSEFSFLKQKLDESKKVVPPQIQRSKDSSRYNLYRLYFIIGQWLTSHRKLHKSVLERNTK